jgi:hypothetical protein
VATSSDMEMLAVLSNATLLRRVLNASGGVAVSGTSITSLMRFDLQTNTTLAASANLRSLVSATLTSTSLLLYWVRSAMAHPATLAAVSSQHPAGVLPVGTCNEGTTIPHSDRTAANPCQGVHDGSNGTRCAFACDAGYVRYGVHRCERDGSFLGGMCVERGLVPIVCGGLHNNDGTGLDAHDFSVHAMHMRMRVALRDMRVGDIPVVDIGAVVDDRGLTSMRKLNISETAYATAADERQCSVYDWTLQALVDGVGSAGAGQPFSAPQIGR